MAENGDELELSPEQLQEAVDTILGQFQYPKRLRVDHEDLEDGMKQTTFTVEDDERREVVVKYDPSSDQSVRVERRD